MFLHHAHRCPCTHLVLLQCSQMETIPHKLWPEGPAAAECPHGRRDCQGQQNQRCLCCCLVALQPGPGRWMAPSICSPHSVVGCQQAQLPAGAARRPVQLLLCYHLGPPSSIGRPI
jgi:hypothetical protein